MTRYQMFETPISFKSRVRCNGCGYGGLFWHKREGDWRLHHWTMPEGDSKPRFVLHRCGFDSWGHPKPTRALAQETPE